MATRSRYNFILGVCVAAGVKLGAQRSIGDRLLHGALHPSGFFIHSLHREPHHLACNKRISKKCVSSSVTNGCYLHPTHAMRAPKTRNSRNIRQNTTSATIVRQHNRQYEIAMSRLKLYIFYTHPPTNRLQSNSYRSRSIRDRASVRTSRCSGTGNPLAACGPPPRSRPARKQKSQNCIRIRLLSQQCNCRCPTTLHSTTATNRTIFIFLTGGVACVGEGENKYEQCPLGCRGQSLL